ncbi:DUF7507 domain-containing protein [Flavobacterium aestivum]|uniref:DUF7507 domain-containing protein n=1 Tax=Flavobacterium aestivum TaxID=3003257 RepID=UPI0024825CDC|nr:gliding motility-associated C-terminal domain-containing protein [Flavobacterium aestivum]
MNKNVLYFNSLFKKKCTVFAFFLFIVGNSFAKTLGNATVGEMLMRIQGTGIILNGSVFFPPGDFDGDTIADNIDLDDDNDGISDVFELNNFDPNGDEDGDGLPNYRDVYDNTPLNDDQNLTDYLDINGDGTPEVYDADGDGFLNNVDLDSDGDGCMDVKEQFGSSIVDGDDDGVYGIGIPAVDAQGMVLDVKGRTDINYATSINARVQTYITSPPYTPAQAINPGGSVHLSLASTAVNPTYQWQQSIDGLIWTDLVNSTDVNASPFINGVTTIGLDITNIPSSYNGYIYRVVINSDPYSCNAIVSKGNAKLNVSPGPEIKSSDSKEVPENTIDVITVEATVSGLPVQTLKYSIIGGVDASKFVINRDTGELEFNPASAAPDFENPKDVGLDNVYNVQVKVTDTATGFAAQQDIKVTVTNVNEAPVITSNGGGLTVPINVPENKTDVTTVIATDPDLPSQVLKYRITGDDASKFEINETTGKLVFNPAPDFEKPTDVGTNNVYNVQVTVTDNGTTPLFVVQDLIVTVTNVNEAPKFTNNGGISNPKINVPENTTLVTTLTAKDPDLPSQNLTFSIINRDDASKFIIFIVNSTTAVLVFKERPNFENPTDVGKNNVYNVRVRVTDSGLLWHEEDIEITVIDVNETPVAVKDSGVTDENVSVTLNVCTNDSDVDGSIDVATVDLDPNTVGIQTSLTTNQGKWSVDNLGIVTFVPALDFAGTSTIYYAVKDNLGLVSNTAEIAVVVNDLPAVKKPGIALIKTAEFNDLNGDESANIGETITYNFVVTNTGDFPLTNIKVTDPLSGITMPNAEIALNVGESDSTTFTATYTLTQEDIVRGNVTNQATVVGTSSDGTIVKDLSDDSSVLENNPTVTPVSGCSIKVFNALTPEGQSKNKVLYIRGIECYPDNRLEVYNRWGVLVYEGEHYNNVDNVFEGISKGRVTIGASQVLPVGTYFYSLKYKDDKANAYEKSGYLYLNRD